MDIEQVLALPDNPVGFDSSTTVGRPVKVTWITPKQHIA